MRTCSDLVQSGWPGLLHGDGHLTETTLRKSGSLVAEDVTAAGQEPVGGASTEERSRALQLLSPGPSLLETLLPVGVPTFHETPLWSSQTELSLCCFTQALPETQRLMTIA